MIKILCDYENFMALFGNFISMFGSQFYVGFFSAHLKKRFNVDNKAIGLYWGSYSIAYLIGCTTFPYIFESVPPLLQYFVSFFLLGISCMLGGPSELFNLPEKEYLIIIGLLLMGAAAVPAFIYALPNVILNTQLKYKIVEKADEKLDGYIAD